MCCVMENNLAEVAKSIFFAAVAAVDPYMAVKRYVKREQDVLTVGEKKYSLSKFKRIFIIGVGKAGFPMAKAMEEILGDEITRGIVVVKYGHGGELEKVEVLESSHPIPDKEGLRAAQQIISLLEKTGEGDLVICLISGGGSALLPAPVEGISLEEKQKVTRLLLACGASIEEINTIRKHLSRMKGGQLARAIYPAHLQSLILSDVVGDRLDTIASGPTVPDDTTFYDCWRIMEKYALLSKLPESVKKYLKEGLEGKIQETPKIKDVAFERVDNLIVGSNVLALKAAKDKAEKSGYNCLILSSFIEGDTGEAAKFHVALAKEIKSSGNPIPPPACILSGGETTVKVKGRGLGGRCQEFSLVACMEMQDIQDTLILCAGTDGTDGPTDAAGAFASGSILKKAKNMGILPSEFLANNNSYNFFKKVGGLFVTGPTQTNVMDLRILLVKR
ncbi:glycerate kinase [Candidatus Aerophobetes bacterium]|nr:glycerate kinase [Candidatus Aerophobetes bacterium]